MSNVKCLDISPHPIMSTCSSLCACKVMEELAQVGGENLHLLNHIEQITEELEEKAPALQKLRRDYDQTLISNNSLTTKLNTLFEDSEILRLESEDSVRQAKVCERENARLKSVNGDLGRQVKVHTYTHTYIPTPYIDHMFEVREVVRAGLCRELRSGSVGQWL